MFMLHFLKLRVHDNGWVAFTLSLGGFTLLQLSLSLWHSLCITLLSTTPAKMRPTQDNGGGPARAIRRTDTRMKCNRQFSVKAEDNSEIVKFIP